MASPRLKGRLPCSICPVFDELISLMRSAVEKRAGTYLKSVKINIGRINGFHSSNLAPQR
jgi:hypothetical protein